MHITWVAAAAAAVLCTVHLLSQQAIQLAIR